MFPKDYEISRDRLIWLWIAEGFIQSEIQKKSLFEIGECYFSELVNRSMIQLRINKYTSMVISCRVHDMVLNLICSLSNEEKFVAIQSNVGYSSSAKKVRRLSLQNGKAGHGKSNKPTLVSMKSKTKKNLSLMLLSGLVIDLSYLILCPSSMTRMRRSLLSSMPHTSRTRRVMRYIG
jgi:hypothetical protein